MQENINIPDSEITTNLSFRQLVLMNMQQLTNFPYIEKDFDALTDYELLCLVVKFLNDVIANQNEQNASITRMYESFLALQDYVNNTKDELETAFNNLDNYVRYYFDNLDVQEEINNKLDQMLEDGVLEQIIEQFLQLTSLICFDNVADMKSSVNLANGSYAKTLGYYSKNDGGSALYKIRAITNDDVVDNMFIIEMEDNNLVAELIIENNTVNINQIGGKGDEITDNHNIILNALNYINKTKSTHSSVSSLNSYYTLEFNKGVYLNNSLISFDDYIDDLKIKGNGAYIIGYGFKFGTKIGYKIEVDSLNFYNVNKCYEFDYIDKNYQQMIFKNSTFRNCDNVFIINRRTCMVKIENCKFPNVKKALYINNVDKVEIANCWFQTTNEQVDDYFSVIEQTGTQEGWIDVHDSFFIPQLQGNNISWFKINKKLTFHENRASGESPNQIALVYTSSDMDAADVSKQRYNISIYNNPIIDSKHLVILNGIPNLLNISNNGGYDIVSNKLIIWDPVLTSEQQETKLQSKLSNFKITLIGNSFRQFDYLTGDINLPSGVKPIIPDNLLNYIQRSYRSIDNQMQTKIISKDMTGTNLNELKFQIFDLSSYTKRNNSGSMWLLCYKGYSGGSATAETMIDVISLKQNSSSSIFTINVESIVGTRTGDYTVTFEGGETSVDTTQTPNPILVITPNSNRYVSYPQFSKIELADMLTLGQL